ncbi:hypothetical protein [Acetobacter fallax]|uniref:Uncharacterized protein n=1 Tax=Acetobacter fallax TaxID=1737473 RepID=A0ABX0KHF8_9PROT|nr:hypothetical protein [Acetobacter fallax]NHO34438.1 hypothetical protein [Acetobacter fallax]NHO37999.1 hypothetical protein [Acetobacter fallax]
MKQVLRLMTGLGLPTVATLGMIPVVGCFGKTIFGVPTIIVVIGSLFFITSGCMATCWLLFDRNDVRDQEV